MRIFRFIKECIKAMGYTIQDIVSTIKQMWDSTYKLPNKSIEKLFRAVKQKEIESKIKYEILYDLVNEIGSQVTMSYESKNGIWEGLSISNVGTINKYYKKIENVLKEIIK